MQTEPDKQQQKQAQPQRRGETTNRFEARISQYKDFIKRRNEAMERVRKDNKRFEERCKELEEEIRAKDIRQNQTDERLDEQQRLFRQLEQDLAEVTQQTAYLTDHIGGIPLPVCVTRQGRKFHLDHQCSSLSQSTEVCDYEYCGLCVNRVIPAHRRPLGSSGGT